MIRHCNAHKISQWIGNANTKHSPKSTVATINRHNARIPQWRHPTTKTVRFFSKPAEPKGGFWKDFAQDLQELWQGVKNLSWNDVRELGRDSAILMSRLALAYGAFWCIGEHCCFLVICDGPSMMPTMNSVGEIILVERITPRLYGIDGGSRGQDRIQHAREKQREHPNPDEWYQPFVPVNEMPTEGKWARLFANVRTGISLGDIVVAENPTKAGTVCKRVIGLPGDEIILKQSQYTASHFLGRSSQQTAKLRKVLQKIPDGHVWLEGDNSSNSNDSRNYGSIPAAMILGRVILRVWPPKNAVLERAMGPKSTSQMGSPRWNAQASAVLPAGYNGQRLVKQYRQNVA